MVIDIKPGSDPSSANLNGNGVAPVAVLGSAYSDVTAIDVGTVTSGLIGTEATPRSRSDTSTTCSGAKATRSRTSTEAD